MSEKDPREGPHIKAIDNFLRCTLLRFIPHSISPNSVTVLRFLSVPVVAALLLMDSIAWGAGVFAFGALTDALDGAMARTRNRITQWGKIADPLADKLLVGTTALILVTRYVSFWVALALIAVELVTITRAVYMYAHGQNAGANAMGKIKMVIQCVALLTLFVYVLSGTGIFLTLATGGLYLAIFFALLSLSFAPSV